MFTAQQRSPHDTTQQQSPPTHPWIPTHRVLYIRQRLLSAFPRQAASLGGARFNKTLLAEDNLYVSFVGFWGVGKSMGWVDIGCVG